MRLTNLFHCSQRKSKGPKTRVVIRSTVRKPGVSPSGSNCSAENQTFDVFASLSRQCRDADSSVQTKAASVALCHPPRARVARNERGGLPVEFGIDCAQPNVLPLPIAIATTLPVPSGRAKRSGCWMPAQNLQIADKRRGTSAAGRLSDESMDMNLVVHCVESPVFPIEHKLPAGFVLRHWKQRIRGQLAPCSQVA